MSFLTSMRLLIDLKFYAYLFQVILLGIKNVQCLINNTCYTFEYVILKSLNTGCPKFNLTKDIFFICRYKQYIFSSCVVELDMKLKYIFVVISKQI